MAKGAIAIANHLNEATSLRNLNLGINKYIYIYIYICT